MKNIATALVKAQKAFGPALKSSTNPHFKSRYADLAACVDRPIEALAGASLAMRHAASERIDANRWQGAMCPGGFRMWPLEGYWNEGEVRTLFAW